MKKYESAKLQLYRSESYNNQYGEIRHLFDRSIFKSLKVLCGQIYLLPRSTAFITYENYLSENSQHCGLVTHDVRMHQVKLLL
jgi:hypothetical protein